MYKTVIIVFSTFLFIFSCDSDKFLSFNYEAEQILEISTVTGRITNQFTGAPVNDAVIQIGLQTATSDADGFYRLDYELTTDNELGQEVDITISAEDYHEFTTSRQFFPQPVELNFQMEFGAPIFEAISFAELSFCQVRIFDYQGAEDIDTIFAQIPYLDPTTRDVVAERTVGLELIEILDINRAHYQAVVPAEDPQLGNAAQAIRVTAIDKSGFIRVFDHVNNVQFQPDTLLFDPGI